MIDKCVNIILYYMTTEANTATRHNFLKQVINDINSNNHERIVSSVDGFMILRTERVMAERYEEKGRRSEASRENCGWLSTYIGAIVRGYVHDYKEATRAHFFTKGGVPFSFTKYTVSALSNLPESFMDGLNLLDTSASEDSPPDNWLTQLALLINNHQNHTGVKPEDLGLELWPEVSNGKANDVKLTATLTLNKARDLLDKIPRFSGITPKLAPTQSTSSPR